MENTWKSSGWFLVALLTCPCHFVLLLPLLAGTALGSYFMEFKDVVFIVMGLLFIFALFTGWRKFDQGSQKKTKKESTPIHDCCSLEREKS